MQIKYNWTNYNLKRNKEAIKIHRFNLTNKFNFIEKGVYKNVRDIYALSLLIAKQKNKRINILDFGGNLMSHVNLRNKINSKKINFYIYSPHSTNYDKKTIGLKIVNIKNLNKIIPKKFDLIYFGSVLQYIENLKSISTSLINNSKYILITHTPVTLRAKSYTENQNNANKLRQKIHTLNQIIKGIFSNFNLIFKSRNEYKYTGIKIKKKNTFSLNLLLKNKIIK